MVLRSGILKRFFKGKRSHKKKDKKKENGCLALLEQFSVNILILPLSLSLSVLKRLYGSGELGLGEQLEMVKTFVALALHVVGFFPPLSGKLKDKCV